MKTYRHTHTSLLAETEVVLEDMMEILGQLDDDTTRFIYRHVTKEMKEKGFSQVWSTNEKPLLILLFFIKMLLLNFLTLK
jgi:integrase